MILPTEVPRNEAALEKEVYQKNEVAQGDAVHHVNIALLDPGRDLESEVPHVSGV